MAVYANASLLFLSANGARQIGQNKALAITCMLMQLQALHLLFAGLSSCIKRFCQHVLNALYSSSCGVGNTKFLPHDTSALGSLHTMSLKSLKSCAYCTASIQQSEQCAESIAECLQEVGLQPALAEQQRVVQEFGAEISQDALNHMEALQRNITEALRMNPPLTLLLRQVKKSFAVTTSSGKTHIVPKVPAVF